MAPPTTFHEIRLAGMIAELRRTEDWEGFDDSSEMLLSAAEQRLTLKDDVAEYEAKYGPVMGVTRAERLKQVIEERRKTQPAHRNEDDLVFVAEKHVDLDEVLAQLEAQKKIRKERGEKTNGWGRELK